MQLINSASAVGNTSGVSIGPLQVNAGDLVVLIFSFLGATTINTVSDNLGNIYTPVIEEGTVISTVEYALDMYSGIIVNGGALTFSMGLGNPVGLNVRGIALNYIGCTNTVDQKGSTTATLSASYATSTINTVYANDLIIAAFLQTVAQTITTTGTMNQEVALPSPPDTMVQDQIVLNTGTYTGTATVATADGYLAIIAAFKGSIPPYQPLPMGDTDFQWLGGDD